MSKNAMKVLAERNLLRAGMEIEPVPEIMPSRISLGEFRSTILNPNGGSGSIQWRGEIYSPSQMLAYLEREHGACGLYGLLRNFRIVGHDSSLRDEAEKLLHPGEEIADQEEPEKQPPPVPITPTKERTKKSQARKIALAAVKAFFVMIATTLGAKFGGWLGGAIAAAIAGAFAVVIGPDANVSEHTG